MSRRGSRRLLVAVAAVLLEAEVRETTSAPVPSTRAADLTLVQTIVRVDPRRAARIGRIRRRVASPRALPRALRRRVSPAVVVLAAAGELSPGTFAASVVLIVRRGTPASELETGAGDLEARFARAAVARLIGVAPRRRSVLQERAPNLLSTVPPASFCQGALPASLVSALSSPILHVEGSPIVPWTPSALLRGSIGLAFRACGLPLPALLLPEEVDDVAREIDRVPGGTTTTTLPEECRSSAQLETRTLTDPAHPECTDLEWITPIPDCADDLAFELIYVATGEPVGSQLFGHTTLVTYFFGLHPVRLVVRACNGEPGSPGGSAASLYAIVSWGG